MKVQILSWSARRGGAARAANRLFNAIKKNESNAVQIRITVNDKESSENALEANIRDAIGNDDGLVVLHCDKDVPVEKLVNVAGIATSLEAKVTIATTPK